MSSLSATRRASPASIAEQHPFLLSRRASSCVCAPVRMNSPITSYPCRFSSTADAELSTPPLIASTTRTMHLLLRTLRPAAHPFSIAAAD